MVGIEKTNSLCASMKIIELVRPLINNENSILMVDKINLLLNGLCCFRSVVGASIKLFVAVAQDLFVLW